MGIAIDGTNAYWVNQGLNGGSVMKMPLYGGTPVTLATSQSYYPKDIAVDASNVYWDNAAGSGSIMKVPIAGGDPVTLASDARLVNISSMAIDDTAAYWTNAGDAAGTGSIMKVPLAGGNAQVLTDKINHPLSIAAFNGVVYFLTADSSAPGIMKVSASGGAVSTVPQSAGAFIVAVDASGIFFTSSATSFTLTQLSLTGTTSTDLTHPLRSVTQLVLDAGNVFWTSGADIGVTAKAP